MEAKFAYWKFCRTISIRLQTVKQCYVGFRVSHSYIVVQNGYPKDAGQYWIRKFKEAKEKGASIEFRCPSPVTYDDVKRLHNLHCFVVHEGGNRFSFLLHDETRTTDLANSYNLPQEWRQKVDQIVKNKLDQFRTAYLR